MLPEPIRVLILCTHNSARSQIAEAMLRQMGGSDFAVASAGTEATRVNPLAIAVLEEAGYRTDGLYSKVLTRFLGEHFDVVLTVCDEANERCPIFPGAPERIHWSIPDPSAVQGSEEERLRAFRAVRDKLTQRLPPFIARQRQKRDVMAPATTEGGR
jgi:arsenate reductase